MVVLGGEGALLVSANERHFWPSIPVTAVDTTAAGDAFNAGFALALAEGMSEQDAGRFATATAARSAMRPGAQPALYADSRGSKRASPDNSSQTPPNTCPTIFRLSLTLIRANLCILGTSATI
ncbi:MAG: PfkB family carbohydrate kinase [Pyrinomonadaceae bacterium]